MSVIVKMIIFFLLALMTLHHTLFILMKLMIKCAVFCCRENLPAVLPQPHRAVRAAEEARPGCSVPDSPLPRQDLTQVGPTRTKFLVWINTPACCCTRTVQSFYFSLSTIMTNCCGVRKKEKRWPASLPLDVMSSLKTVVATTWLFFLLRRFALTTKIPDTKGCHKCCIGEWPLPRPLSFSWLTHPSY